MSSKQQFRDLVKREKQTIIDLKSENDLLKLKCMQLENQIRIMGLPEYLSKLSYMKVKKWWQFWK